MSISNPADQRISQGRALRLIGSGVVGAIGGSWLTSSLNATQTNAPTIHLPNVVQNPPLTIRTKYGIPVHSIQTGFVAVKRAHRDMVGLEAARLLTIALDARWTEWMPIYTWVIEHPEGVIVVDTGETSQTSDPAYFDCDLVTAWIYRNNLRFVVSSVDEIGNQLPTLGIDPMDVRWVVQTHLHSDHMGGLAAFPNATVYVPREDYPASAGVLTCRLPADFSPQFPAFETVDVPGFGRGFRVTSDGTVTILPTPGHSMGHQSVLLDDGDIQYLFAGDTSFDEAQLRDGRIGGIVADTTLARATLENLRVLIRNLPTVYLPTHDPESGRRFADGLSTVL
jgi:glyoxylase-like metal-dependent hydrolase (beta-lactamase superfamily II)